MLNFTLKVYDSTKHCFGFKFSSIKQYSLCYWSVNVSPLVNQVMNKRHITFPKHHINVSTA
jgi:hypothetical protein